MQAEFDDLSRSSLNYLFITFFLVVLLSLYFGLIFLSNEKAEFAGHLMNFEVVYVSHHK